MDRLILGVSLEESSQFGCPRTLLAIHFGCLARGVLPVRLPPHPSGDPFCVFRLRSPPSSAAPAPFWRSILGVSLEESSQFGCPRALLAIHFGRFALGVLPVRLPPHPSGDPFWAFRSRSPPSSAAPAPFWRSILGVSLEE